QKERNVRRNSPLFQLAVPLACWASLAWVVPSHAWASTATAASDCPPGYLPNPVPPEVLAVVASQQQIHQQLFNQPYSWCIGGGWLLDQEIFQGPTDPLEPVIITGETPGGEPLVFELYVAARLDDWSQIGTLSTEEKQWADNHDYALVFAGGVATGPVGSVELWGMAQSVTDDSGTRFHVFTPHMEGPIVP